MLCTNLESACDEHEHLYKHQVSGYPLHLPPSQWKWTFYCSVVWGKISNEAATKSSNVPSGASDPSGSFRTTIEGTGRQQTARTLIFEEGVMHAEDQWSVTVYGLLPLQPEDLEQLSIVCCRAKSYIHFKYREYSYYFQMITHDESRLQSGLLTKVRQTCTLSVPCCSVMKQPFHV
ncbi:hypothetical protein TNCV_5019891 [Trichonephila clavipes]|nr:hypothetical protein TNCV_5019891 [Trichonephila clavipes]